MAGIDNNVLYAENVDFSGTFPVSASVTLDGELLIGSTAAPNIRVGTLTAGTGISIVNGPGSITVSAASVGMTWTAVTSASNPVTLAANNGYITKGAGVVDFVLPAAAAIGDAFRIIGYGNLWTIAQNAGQSIRIGSSVSTSGVSGSVSASMVTDCLDIICVTTNLEFFCDVVQGNPIIV